MIDISTDESGHSLRMLVWQAIRLYPTASLFPFLNDPDVIVRSIAAREIQMRGGRDVLKRTLKLLEGGKAQQREMAAFILGQLKMRPDDIQPTLRSLRAHLDVEANSAALIQNILSIARLGSLRDVESLTRYRKGRSAGVRGALALAYGFVGSKN